MRIAIIIMACLMAGSASADELKISKSQEKALRTFYDYLEREGYNPEVDTTDYSVCFRNRDRVLYWVTFSDSSPMCYTLHRKGFKVGTANDEYRRNTAILAANEVNQKYPDLSISVTDSKVNIEMKTYAATTQDYIKMFKECYGKFGSVDEDFKKSYAAIRKDERETQEREEKKIQDMVAPSQLKDQIEYVAFRLMDAQDNVVTDYDKPLKARNAQYLQLRIDFRPWRNEPLETTLYIRIIRPDGQPIYLPGKKYSMDMPIELDKSRQMQQKESDCFGSEKDDFWTPGTYKVEILDGLTVIAEEEFSLL